MASFYAYKYSTLDVVYLYREYPHDRRRPSYRIRMRNLWLGKSWNRGLQGTCSNWPPVKIWRGGEEAMRIMAGVESVSKESYSTRIFLGPKPNMQSGSCCLRIEEDLINDTPRNLMPMLR
jgi:hypothetical protein